MFTSTSVSTDSSGGTNLNWIIIHNSVAVRFINVKTILLCLFTKMLNVNNKIKVSSGTINFFRYYYKKYDLIKKKTNYQSLISQFCFRLKNRFDINLDYNEVIAHKKKKLF